MKRRFCNYYIYQRDVMRSVTLDGSFDYNGNGIVGDEGDKVLAYKKDVYGNYLDSEGNITTDPSKYVQLWIDQANNSPAYEIMWVSVSNQTYWDSWDSETDGDPETGANKERAYKVSEGVYLKKPKYYDDAIALNGKVLDKLQDCHYNRKVLLDVVYEVQPEEFRFAYRGRNTRAWYQMMTSNSADGLLNFTYKNGIGNKPDNETHYTNDYLWAPQGDPYGFVMRSRYATINGAGWNDMAMTTKGHLPKESDHTSYSESAVLAANANAYNATYTNQTPFDAKRIIHSLNGENGADSDGPSNAVYEMFTGDAGFGSSFLMHPTCAYLDNEDADFNSYYMIYDTGTQKTKLTYASGRSLQLNTHANWQMHVSAEQLWPYFKYAGYVGGIDPIKAQNFTNQDYYIQLKTAVEGGTTPTFTTLRDIQDVVYAGTFKDNTGTVVTEGSARPAASLLPMTFEAENLVNMKENYYRIQGFSEQKLNTAETSDGIQGPRYVSGYRFASEVTNTKPLRFFETSQDNAQIHTFADLATKKSFSDATPGSTILQGNIELLPVDYDASSVFRFTKQADNYSRWTLSSQGLNVQGSVGSTSMSAADGTKFRLDDIGGAAVTLRFFSSEPVAGNWDTEVKSTLQTNYLNSNGDSYALTVTADNEMNQTETTDIQDTKWRLQPVGIREPWPYNEMPLRVEVQKGGVDKNGSEDKYYYGSLYVPFDTRLGNTTDAAFTLTGTVIDEQPVTLASVSQYNDMGNPLFIPAAWPVILRTNIASNVVTLKNQKVGDADPTTYAVRHYVNMYIPNITPTVISGALSSIKLSGQYLEKMLTSADLGGEEPSSKTIMVFGLPYENCETSHTSHDYDDTKQVGFFSNDNWARESYSGYKAHSTSYAAVGTAGTVADHGQRSNKYVYHNKIYYVLDKAYSGPAPSRYTITIFGDEEEEEIENGVIEQHPWPCNVYDLQGRRVATNETPQTLRRNYPSLPQGVYIFGGKKVVVK